eukprot:s728_g40.t1
MAEMVEVKNNLGQKVKSIKRRKGYNPDLVMTLEGLLATVNSIHDFIKKVATGPADGTQLYDEATSMDLTVGTVVFKRVLKAVAMEDSLRPVICNSLVCLKLHAATVCTKYTCRHAGVQDLKVAQWSNFFSKTCELCTKHIEGGNEAKEFFSTLCGQILMKLVKGVPGNKPVSPESLTYLKGFVDELHSHMADSRSDTQPEEHESAISALHCIVDFGTSPSKLNSILEGLTFDKHWALSPFGTQQGMRILEAAKENAKKREGIGKVIDEVEERIRKLKDTGLCETTIKSDDADDEKTGFSAEFGKLLSETHAFMGNKQVRALRGVDKECVTKLAALVQAGSKAVIEAHIGWELMPGLATFLKSSPPVPIVLLHAESCLAHLQSSLAPLAQTFKDFAAYFTSLTSDCQKLSSGVDGSIGTEQIPSIKQKWEKHSTAVVKTIGVHDATAGFESTLQTRAPLGDI